MLVGINHVALEVGDLDEALAFYEQVFGELTLRGRGTTMAFVDMGDQFLALASGRTQKPDAARHIGIVVADKEAVRERLRAAGIDAAAAPGLDFRDPWGNHVQIVDYREVQFTKTTAVLRGMGLDGIEKTDKARAELQEKGLA